MRATNERDGAPPGLGAAARETETARQEVAAQAEGTAAVQLRRRLIAAGRCEPLPWRTSFGDSGLRARDPWLPCQRHGSPSTFSLAPHEIRAEANRLAALGWDLDEVIAVLAVAPREVPK